MSRAIGTCSECGGPVKLPDMMVDPVPCCAKCGATPKHKYGPVIEMEPAPRPAKPEWQRNIDMARERGWLD